MKRLLRVAAALAVGVLPAAAAPPARIVSTSPSITEILFALGLGSRVVGVTNYCHYPPQVKQLPKVGTFLRPNMETIASLRPDLVVIERNPINLAGSLATLNLKSVEVNPEGVAGIYATITRLGEVTGAQPDAARLRASIQAQLDAVKASVAGRPRRTVAFLVGRTPGTLEGIVAAGRGSFLNELMEMAGGDNVFRQAAGTYPKVPLEELFSRNPDVIIDMGDMAETATVTEQHKRNVVRLWQRYPVLRAVREHHVWPVASDIYVVPGPRVVEAAREFAKMFYSEGPR
jgi:iron complex transport system substrate-binding protein